MTTFWSSTRSWLSLVVVLDDTMVNVAQSGFEVGASHNITDAGAPKSNGASVCVEVPDFVLLYFTLVADRAIPSGYLDHFLSLEPHSQAAAERADRRNVAITNLCGSMVTQSMAQN